MALEVTRVYRKKDGTHWAELNHGLVVGPVDDVVYIAQLDQLERELGQQIVRPKPTEAELARQREKRL